MAGKKRVKRFAISPSTAYIVKQFLETIKTTDMKSARAVLATIDAVDAVHNHVGAHKTRTDEITLLEDIGKLKQAGKPLSEAQRAIDQMPRFAFWANLYATMDADNPASGEVIVSEEAADEVVKILSKLEVDASVSRMLIAFCDAVECATSSVEGESAQAKPLKVMSAAG